MRRSLRLFGNRVLFSITWISQNATVGRYRAFVTDPKRAVVLRYESRVVVVSSANADALLGYLKPVAPATVAGKPPSASERRVQQARLGGCVRDGRASVHRPAIPDLFRSTGVARRRGVG
jgi:hypothetical protein